VTTAIRLLIIVVWMAFAIYAAHWCIKLWRDESALRTLMPRMLAGIGRGDYDLARGHLRASLVTTLIGGIGLGLLSGQVNNQVSAWRRGSEWD